jgi:hypothetical protein
MGFRMITEQDLKKNGYTVLPNGGYIRIDPTMMPYDWSDVCKDFGADPDCKEIVLAVCGVLEIHDE